MKNFIARFGQFFNNGLADGSSPNQLFIDLNDERPVWSTPYKYKGLQILINDTEQTFVYLQSFQWLNAQQTQWKGNFCFKVVDNYGLDDQDAITYGPQFGGGGFFSWWILQYHRGHAPFINHIYINANVEGSFN